MKKKVKLTITGIQSAFGQEDVSELITTADFYHKDGKYYIFYSEYTEDQQVIKNRLTITPDHVELKKTGSGSSHLSFTENKMEPCRYQSPLGLMDLLSDTRKITLKVRKDTLHLALDYSLLLNGSLMSDYKLTVQTETLD